VVDKIEGTPLELSYYHGGYNTRNAKYGIPEGLSINDDEIMDKFNGPISKVILPVERISRRTALWYALPAAPLRTLLAEIFNFGELPDSSREKAPDFSQIS
jgi:hypothetical protein